MAMLFEWDEAKSQQTFRDRGFGFDYAAAIFGGLTLERQDVRRDYGETRTQAIGRVGVDILFVVYTDRGEVCHIISAGAPAERNVHNGTRSPNIGSSPADEAPD